MTADGVLLELEEPDDDESSELEPEESSDDEEPSELEPDESSDDVVVLPDEEVVFSDDEVVSSDVLVGFSDGGFSGRESEVTVAWLADMVRAGRIRWVLADSSGGGFGANDGRTGATTAMAAVAQTCTPVSTSGSSSSTTGTASGLYDCGGKADALASAAAS